MRRDPPSAPRVYISSRGEVVDFFNGEVEEDHYIVSKPTIRASDYAEWELKKHHEILVTERDRKLYRIVWDVGEKINAPKWLRMEVFRFYKVMPRIKAENLIRRDLPKNFKAVLAVYYVLSYIFKLYDTLDNIKSMDCGDGVPCWASRRKHDKMFRKYVNTARLYLLHIYKSKLERRPEDIIRYYSSKFNFIPEAVVEKAVEIARKHWGKLHVRKDEIVFASAVTAACFKEFKNKEFCYTLRSQICKKLHMIPYNINKIVKELLEEPD